MLRHFEKQLVPCVCPQFTKVCADAYLTLRGRGATWLDYCATRAPREVSDKSSIVVKQGTQTGRLLLIAQLPSLLSQVPAVLKAV